MFQLNFYKLRFISVLLLFLTALISLNTKQGVAQLKEPPVRAVDEPETPFGQGLRNRLGVTFLLNNFGFGVSGVYGRAVGPFTEITFTFSITGIRDVSAQEFIFFRTGRKIVPNRYKRALGFPLMIGIEQRLFPRIIADNFRFFISADGGFAFAYTYPYFEDTNGNGYRDTFLVESVFGPRLVFAEDINSFFGGLGNGDWHFGFAGDLSIGVDIGSDFENQLTFEIGYFFYYYPQGLQIMEPYKKERYIQFRPPTQSPEPCQLNQGSLICLSTGQQSYYNEQAYFGTPQIKISYSWWL